MDAALPPLYLCATKVKEMATKETIAIIGATGDTGSAISKSLAKHPYRLLLMSTEKDELNELAEVIKAIDPLADFDIIHCPIDASWEADIIILAVPYHEEKEVAESIKEVATGKMLISITDPAASGIQAEELQKVLPYSRIVRIFNIADLSKHIDTSFIHL
jgi:predicted dinucleotide-binding enzyme